MPWCGKFICLDGVYSLNIKKQDFWRAGVSPNQRSRDSEGQYRMADRGGWLGLQHYGELIPSDTRQLELSSDKRGSAVLRCYLPSGHGKWLRLTIYFLAL